MEAGREMDALIAEKIFGLAWLRGQYGKYEYLRQDDDTKYACAKLLATGELFPNKTLPKYSTDIAAAWQVVEKMSSRKDWDEHPVCIVRNYAFKDMWTVELRDYDFDATAETAPLAICRAALLAAMA
jgi:hypothetical protein